METIQLNPLCIDVYHENGVYEIALLKSSRDAVDKWFEMMDLAYARTAADQKLQILIDL